MIKQVIKFDGTSEDFSSEKVGRWGKWSARNLGKYVDWPSIVIDAVNESPSVCSTQDLQLKLIDVILRGESWSHYLMAGRLYAPYLHKKTYGKTTPTVKAVHEQLAELGYMYRLNYSDAEYAEVEKIINHKLDNDYPHFRLDYLYKKYALQNRVDKKVYETAQFVYMRMAMALAEDQPAERRMRDIRKFYKYFSKGAINAPTPNFINLGTPSSAYASCCIYSNLDSAESIGIGLHIAYTMTYMSAGCGTHLNTRSLGDAVRGGMIEHQGKLPYIRATRSMVQANLQNGRGGADTLTWSAFDPEGEILVGLQNPMATEERKIRGIDYSMTTNRFMARFAAQRGKLFRFNCHTAPDLFEAFYSADFERFEALYAQYEADPLFVKDYFNAREQILLALNEGYETGRYYLTWADEMNRHTPFYDSIYASNLCVAPETPILTDKGFVKIASVANTTVNVWNGREYSAVDVQQTGRNQPMIRVVTDSGQELECTLYHKFYVIEAGGDVKEVHAGDLQSGDTLIPFDLPVIEGRHELDHAYTNGFYAVDGQQVDGHQRLYLYGMKMLLADRFTGGSQWVHGEQGKYQFKVLTGLQDKRFVPGTEYTVSSRIQWLSGYLEAAATVYRDSQVPRLAVSSGDREFLKNVQWLLLGLGVQSKLYLAREGDSKPVQFTRDLVKYPTCQGKWKLSIGTEGIKHLFDLGLQFDRIIALDLPANLSAPAPIKIETVIDEGRVDHTYCFTEPKRHMGMFGGILTGQCQEIMLPQRGYERMQDLYVEGDVGFIRFTDDRGVEVKLTASLAVEVKDQERSIIPAIELKRGQTYWVNGHRMGTVLEILETKKEPEVAMCNIGGLVPSELETDEEYAEAAYYALLMVDICIHKSTYALPHIGFTSKARLNAGIGIMGLAYWMAKNGHSYKTEEGKNAIHKLNETHFYHLVTQSIKLGQERGNAPWIHRTKWPEGYLPLDSYNKNVDALHSQPLTRDWDEVRSSLIENKGMRFSVLASHMPGESSSKASGQPNSNYPVRELVLSKSDNGIKSYWAAPEGERLANAYESAWDIETTHQIDLYAITQKWTDQGISADLWRRIPEGDQVTSTEMLNVYFEMTKKGLKSRYYQNSLTSKRKRLDDGSEVLVDVLNTEGEEAADCGAGGCKM